MLKTLIVSIISAWVFAKLVKLGLDLYKERKINWRTLTHDGGMPSTHTALVVALAVAMYLEGVSAYTVIVCVVIALIVINDALKVRWVTGEQSKQLNKLTHAKKGFERLEESIGHTWLEVAVGAAIGIIVPFLAYSLF